jgi:hypothetical protein
MKATVLFVSLCLICVLGICAFSALPRDSTPIIQEKYSGWAGVIRIWVCDDMSIDPAAWLGACAARFEKSHEGIYVNVQTVPAQALTGLRESGINPPDMIVWPVGLLEDSAGLYELTGEYPLRAGLDISRYAVPVLTGAHTWIFDTGAYSALPSDMYDVPIACRSDDLPAMVALSTGLRVGETAESALPGVDLGLSGERTATPAPEGTVECRASQNLIVSDDARALFKSDEAAAFVGDLSDIARLGDDAAWQVCVTGEYTYVDEMALCSIVSREGAAAAERRSLCEDLLSLMLGEGQLLAAKAGAMPAAAGVTAHSGDAVYSAVEAGLDGLYCLCPPAFGSAAAPAEPGLYVEGKITADQAAERMAAGR